MIVTLNVLAKLFLCLFGVEFRIGLHSFHKLVIAVDRSVVLENIEDEAFLNRLLHRVAVEWFVLYLAFRIRWQRFTKHLQSLVLRRSGKGEVTGIRQHL